MTEAEARDVVIAFWKMLDEHAPIHRLLALVAEEGFEIGFRGGQCWRGLDGLEQHQEVKRQFFDEAHVPESLSVTLSPGQAVVKSVMRWEASYREAPAPRSERIKAVLHHTWVIGRSPRDGRPVVKSQIVDSLRWLDGFAPRAGKEGPAPHLSIKDY
jgi:hypothetical protein